MENEHEFEVDLLDLFWYLLRRIKIILAVALLCALAAFGISRYVLPLEYTASTRIYILNRDGQNALSYSDYQIANQMIEDYKVLITGENVTKKVIQQLGLNLTPAVLEKRIELEAPQDTRVLQISITDTDPNRAMLIANKVREVACDEIKRIMDVEAVNLVYEAELPQKPSGPHVARNTVIAAFLGLMLTAAFLTARRLLDDAIRTEEDVSRRLGLGVLGTIPASGTMGEYYDCPEPEGQTVGARSHISGEFLVSEGIKTLRSNLIFSGVDKQIIGITSCHASEGKSTTSLHLAASFARLDKRVLLLDVDLRKSTMAGKFQFTEQDLGVTHYLSGLASLEQILYPTDIPGMDIAYAGKLVPDAAELLSGSLFAELLPILRQRYDYVIVDTPPLGQVIDCAVIAAKLDGIVMLIDTTNNSCRMEKQVHDQITKAGGKVLGVVLNRMDYAEKPGYYGKYYGEQYIYQ